MNDGYSRAWWISMAIVTVAAMAAIVCQPAHAGEWTGKDKAQHAQASTSKTNGLTCP